MAKSVVVPSILKTRQSQWAKGRIVIAGGGAIVLCNGSQCTTTFNAVVLNSPSEGFILGDVKMFSKSESKPFSGTVELTEE